MVQSQYLKIISQHGQSEGITGRKIGMKRGVWWFEKTWRYVITQDFQRGNTKKVLGFASSRWYTTGGRWKLEIVPFTSGNKHRLGQHLLRTPFQHSSKILPETFKPQRTTLKTWLFVGRSPYGKTIYWNFEWKLWRIAYDVEHTPEVTERKAARRFIRFRFSVTEIGWFHSYIGLQNLLQA